MKNGITLLIAIVAITTMLILITSASVIGIKSITEANYIKYMDDIKIVSDNVNVYHLTNNDLPITNEILSADSLGLSFKNNVAINKDENNNLYILDIPKLGNEAITMGRGNLKNRDVFLVAENSHNVYYLKGFKYNGQVYHSFNVVDVETKITNKP